MFESRLRVKRQRKPILISPLKALPTGRHCITCIQIFFMNLLFHAFKTFDCFDISNYKRDTNVGS